MRKKMKMLTVLLLVMLMTFVAVIPAVAATGTTYTAINGGTTTFTKYLVMDSDANVPNVDFTFSVDAGEAVDAADNCLEVLAGVTPENVMLGVGTTSSDMKVSFTTSDVPTSGAADDGITNDTTKQYASKEVILDFSNCSFTKPGVYRYILTEEDKNAPGITYDSTPTRTVDVYVVDATGADGVAALKIDGYVMYSGTVTAAPKAAATSEDTPNGAEPEGAVKTDNYINTYATENLTLAKEVSGNQASRAEYFEFTVTISGATAGTKYTVNLDDAEGAPTVDGEKKANAGTITVPDGETTVTATYWLQGGQSIVIQGLATGTAYEISENADLLNKEGYTTKIDASGTDTDAVRTIDEDNRKIADTGLTSDVQITFINSKSSVIPTGVIMKVVPFVIVGIAVIFVIAVLIIRSRRREEEYDE